LPRRARSNSGRRSGSIADGVSLDLGEAFWRLRSLVVFINIIGGMIIGIAQQGRLPMPLIPTRSLRLVMVWSHRCRADRFDRGWRAGFESGASPVRPTKRC
jgi:hypothetical protein